ncbi:MAG: M20/M25/M40 family metallo-hydrolase [Clostridia bacterium]|nr:M20/M25/M40 family metallo-hydrolase [Clostridia bacterium]
MEIQTFIEQNEAELLQILRELCAIPAPSHEEGERAAYCLRYLEGIGAQGAYIDAAQNVVFPLHCEGSNTMTVFAAHTDTVFPDREPLPYYEDEAVIRCPGVGDDTAGVAVLLLMAKYFVQQALCPPGGILFVCNACEEGLGNLKGTRQLFADYAGRIRQFVTFDSTSFAGMVDRSVGSHRYRVTARTAGGHSFNAFGNRNAIEVLAGIIQDLYAIPVPQKEGSKTTYNVGLVTGGTSVNTIAQEASMLCEYRSDDLACLRQMEKTFASVFGAAGGEDATIEVERMGERPCAGEVDAVAQTALTEHCRAIIRQVCRVSPVCHSGSTDCNIPHSLGVPAVCIGVLEGGGAHTREEWLNKASLTSGLEVALRTALSLGCDENWD